VMLESSTQQQTLSLGKVGRVRRAVAQATVGGQGLAAGWALLLAPQVTLEESHLLSRPSVKHRHCWVLELVGKMVKSQ
jgi:hypothetical protein